jgi:predicted DNA-binding transcriptional regulator YafY
MPSRHITIAAGQAGQVSARRCARLYRLLLLLRAGPRSRSQLTRQVRLDLRGFYRDLNKLRALGVRIVSQGQRYRLGQGFHQAISRLPLPDPRLNLREAITLAEGPTPAHHKLRAQIRKIVGRA